MKYIIDLYNRKHIVCDNCEEASNFIINRITNFDNLYDDLNNIRQIILKFWPKKIDKFKLLVNYDFKGKYTVSGGNRFTRKLIKKYSQLPKPEIETIDYSKIFK
jgi:hypothetical protein